MVRAWRLVGVWLVILLPLVGCAPVYPWPDTCAYNGDLYTHGETICRDNGCERCTCVFGDWRCDASRCQTSCSVGDRTVPLGMVFLAADGCNQCVCLLGNVVACTENPCEVMENSYFAE